MIDAMSKKAYLPPFLSRFAFGLSVVLMLIILCVGFIHLSEILKGTIDGSKRFEEAFIYGCAYFVAFLLSLTLGCIAQILDYTARQCYATESANEAKAEKVAAQIG